MIITIVTKGKKRILDSSFFRNWKTTLIGVLVTIVSIPEVIALKSWDQLFSKTSLPLWLKVLTAIGFYCAKDGNVTGLPKPTIDNISVVSVKDQSTSKTDTLHE